MLFLSPHDFARKAPGAQSHLDSGHSIDRPGTDFGSVVGS